VLALLAGQRDLGPDIGRSHVECLSFLFLTFSMATGAIPASLSCHETPAAGTYSRGLPVVAEAGLEPATQRL
jgi:hypothetical protein